VAFITIDDYTASAGEPSDYPRAEAAIDAACEQVRQYLHQHITFVAGDEVTVSGSGTGALLLPQLPVVAVNSITYDGTDVEGWWVDESGVVRRNAGWPRWRRYVVDYDHGWDEVPVDIVMATVRLAAQLYSSATSGEIRQETIGSYSVTYAVDDGDTSGPLSAIDRRVVKRVPVP
jgi:hypothetical protein